jgi:hypothetical protein
MFWWGQWSSVPPQRLYISYINFVHPLPERWIADLVFEDSWYSFFDKPFDAFTECFLDSYQRSFTPTSGSSRVVILRNSLLCVEKGFHLADIVLPWSESRSYFG